MKIILSDDVGENEEHEFSPAMEKFFLEMIERARLTGGFPQELSPVKLGLNIIVGWLKQQIKNSIEL